MSFLFFLALTAANLNARDFSIREVAGIHGNPCGRSRVVEVSQQLRKLIAETNFSEYHCKCSGYTYEQNVDMIRLSERNLKRFGGTAWYQPGIHIVFDKPVTIATQWPSKLDPRVVEIIASGYPESNETRTVIYFGHRNHFSRPPDVTFDDYIVPGDPFGLSRGECETK
jgi:hypothetical protein